MDLSTKVILLFFALFLTLAVIRLFAAPLKFVLKLLLNTLLGFAALFLLHLTEGITGFALGLNLFNAFVIAILGLPGFVLLVLLKIVFV